MATSAATLTGSRAWQRSYASDGTTSDTVNITILPATCFVMGSGGVLQARRIQVGPT